MVAQLCAIPTELVVLYQLLSAPRRCYTIQALQKADSGSLTVREVARAIAVAETAGTSQLATNSQYRNVYNALTQTHLSKLAAEGIIEYDPDRKVIAAGANLQTANRLLSLSWSLYRLQNNNHRDTPWREIRNG